MKKRTATLSRKTAETNIRMKLSLDGGGPARADTTLPLLDHFLQAFATHGGFGLELKATGDTHVDPHHLIEDCGIVLGLCIARALGGFRGIRRAGFFVFPMDDSLAEVAIDLCGRPNLVWKGKLPRQKAGLFDPELARDFMKGFADSLKATVHVTLRYGANSHHALEAVFKALGRALRDAVTLTGGRSFVSSKKAIDK